MILRKFGYLTNPRRVFTRSEGFLAEILELHKAQRISNHLEVETYTWDVLPAELTVDGVEAGVARELNWVRERLT